MSYIRGQMLYEGKANTLYEVEDHSFYLEMESTDRISAGNGERKGVIKGKGITNNTISTTLFKLFNLKGIPTHFVSKGTNEHSKIVKKAKMIKLEVIGRFIAAGSFCDRYGFEQGKVFDDMIYELCYKDDEKGDPFVSETCAAFGFKVAPLKDLKLIQEYTYAVGIIARDFFKEFGLTLVDFKVEFGYDLKGNLMLADEFSPDTCRLWDENGNSFDKDVFRNGTGDVSETYKRVLEKIQTGKV